MPLLLWAFTPLFQECLYPPFCKIKISMGMSLKTVCPFIRGFVKPECTIAR